MTTLFEYRYPLDCGYHDEGGVFALYEFDGDLWVGCNGRIVRIPRQSYTALNMAMRRHGGGIYLEAAAASPADPSEGTASPPFVSSEVETPERPERSRGSEVETPERPENGIVTNPLDAMRAALSGNLKMMGIKLTTHGLNQLAETACAAYGRHQTGEAYGLPPYEPPTCGTQHLIAERTLRLLGRGTPFADPPCAADVEALSNLVDEAGVAFAREALARDTKPFLLDEDIPF